MKIFVTGGAGFIGRYLVESLLKNHTVTIYDNLENSSQENISSHIELGASFIKGDILDIELLKKSSIGHDVIIHLAAKSDVVESTLDPEITEKTNVEGTKNVIKCCIENNVKKIIFASSAAVYGNAENIPITENTITNPISPYGKSKLSAEKFIKKNCEENNVKYLIFRMFNVYGKGQNKNYSGVITKFLENIVNEQSLEIFGDGKQLRDFISIYDVVKAFECGLKSDKNGTYNIATGESISIKELADWIMLSSGKKVEIKFAEEQKSDIKNSQADVSLAKNELNFVAEKLLKDELVSICRE